MRKNELIVNLYLPCLLLLGVVVTLIAQSSGPFSLVGGVLLVVGFSLFVGDRVFAARGASQSGSERAGLAWGRKKKVALVANALLLVGLILLWFGR